MLKIISITNQKGGVGKTTTAVNLSAALGRLKKKVLIIDIDPQGNSTSGLGFNRKEVILSSYNIMIGDASAKEAILKTEFENLDIIPSSKNLAALEIELADVDSREMYLKKAIDPIKDDYDYIIIDCPPSLGIITTNVLSASNSILVPIQCEFYALEGLTQLMSTVKIVKRQYNPELNLEGILLTMCDRRLNLTQQVIREVKNHFPNKVFNSIIPRTVKLSEAPSFGKPIIYFDKNNKGSDAYISLAKEIIKNKEK